MSLPRHENSLGSESLYTLRKRGQRINFPRRSQGFTVCSDWLGSNALVRKSLNMLPEPDRKVAVVSTQLERTRKDA